MIPLSLASVSLADLGAEVSRSAPAFAPVVPSHALVVASPGRVVDLNRAAPWDLVSTGPAAARGAHLAHTLGSVLDSGDRWVGTSGAAFNFAASSWSVLFAIRVDAPGRGGWAISNIKGPGGSNPWAPGGPFGADRGWGATINGDGGFGVATYGANGWPESHNTDTTYGTISIADSKWRIVEIGLSQNARTSWMTVARRSSVGGVDSIAHATPLGPGDITSPDLFMFGGDYYGQKIAGFTGAIGLPILVFEGAHAETRWLSRLSSLPILQSAWEAFE